MAAPKARNEALEAYVSAIEDARPNRSEAISFSDFTSRFGDPTSHQRFFSRHSFARNYRAVRAAEGVEIAESAQPDELGLYASEFVCNQITSRDVSTRDAQSLLGVDNYTSAYSDEFVVFMFGSLMDGRGLVLRVRGFLPFFDVDLGSLAADASVIQMRFQSKVENGMRQQVNALRSASLPLYFDYFDAATMSGAGPPSRICRIRCPSIAALYRLHEIVARAYPTYNNRLGDARHYYRDFLVETGLSLGKRLSFSRARAYNYENITTTYDASIVYLECVYTNIQTTETPLYHDPSLVMGWDIETYGHGHIELPAAHRRSDEISLICADFNWHWSTTSIASIALTRYKCDIDSYRAAYDHDIMGVGPDGKPCITRKAKPALLVYCATASELLRAFSLLFKRFQPSYVEGFNDSAYDWPWVFYDALRQPDVRDAGSTTPVPFLVRLYTNMCYSESARLALIGGKASPIEVIQSEYENIYPTKISPSLAPKKCYYFRTDGFMCVDLLVANLKNEANAEVTLKSSLSYFASQVLKTHNKVDLGDDSPDPAIAARRDTHAEIRRIVMEARALVATKDEPVGTRMADFIYYCFVDSDICPAMSIKLSLVSDWRSLANETFLSIADIFWFANTLKVINTLVHRGRTAFAHYHGIPMLYNLKRRHGEQPEESEKIGGAYVAQPRTGLKLWSPVFALDINSLYPSVMILLNLCHSQMILCLKLVDGRHELDYAAMALEVERVGWDNVNQLTFQYAGRTYTFFTLKHRGDPSKMGTLPLMLRDIFAKRIIKKESLSKMKNFYGAISNAILAGSAEKVVAVATKWIADSSSIKAPQLREQIIEYATKYRDAADPLRVAKADLEFLAFTVDLADKDQNALKLLMNTSYGALAASHMTIFSLYLASAVTAGGQKIIRHLQELAQLRGFILEYGDTDSMYLSHQIEHWRDQLDEMHEAELEIRDRYSCELSEIEALSAGYDKPNHDEQQVQAKRNLIDNLRVVRRKYYEHVITATIKDAHALVAFINEHLRERNEGQSTITIAYEETLTMILCKKKGYAGLIHKLTPVLDRRLEQMPVEEMIAEKDLLLIKGLDMVKQGIAPITVKASGRMLAAMLDPLSESNLLGREPVDVVLHEMKNIITSDAWTDYEELAQSCKYKEGVLNYPVQEFVARLRARNDPAVPNNGDKMLFVICKSDLPSHNIYGKRNKVSKGQQMELLGVAKERQMEVDKSWYIGKQMMNTFRALTLYRFAYPQPADMDDSKYNESLTKAADSFLSPLLAEMLGEVDEKYHDVRRYMKELSAVMIPGISRIIQSLYSSITRGTFQVHEDAPVMLVNMSPQMIFESVVNDIEAGVGAMTEVVETEESVRAVLEACLPAAAAAYKALMVNIGRWRTTQTAIQQIYIPLEISAPIDVFLNVLDRVRIVNRVTALTLARNCVAC